MWFTVPFITLKFLLAILKYTSVFLHIPFLVLASTFFTLRNQLEYQSLPVVEGCLPTFIVYPHNDEITILYLTVTVCVLTGFPLNFRVACGRHRNLRLFV